MTFARQRRGPLTLVAAALALLLLTITTTVAFAQEGDEGEAFFGTLRFEGDPVAAARITVMDAAEDAVGEATADDEGKWRIVLPGPGTYRATIDTDSLPQGVGLRDPERQSLEVTVVAGQPRPLVFALGAPVAAGPGLGEKLAQAVLNGVKLGLIIAMCAVGLSLIFGTTGLINFAHSELVTFGAIVAWCLHADTIALPLVVAGVLAIGIAGIAGGGVEVGVLRPLRRRRLGVVQFMVVTIGLSLLTRHIMLMFFGPDRSRYLDFALQAEWSFGPFAVTPRDFTVMVLSAFVLVAVALFLQRTRIGKAMRVPDCWQSQVPLGSL